MTAVSNPALQAFLARLGDELLVAQVLVRRRGRQFELRHEADRATPAENLRAVRVAELRQLAQTTESGAFRPLKSAPNLRSGWRALIEDAGELEAALNHLYPGALADWFAAQSPVPPVTSYREFTRRQTGMYRITAMLEDDQAAQAIRACCHRRFCLKQRLWTVPGLDPDTSADKSVIPCLEPCAVLLEFARKAARLEQEDKTSTAFAPGDLESMAAGLELALTLAPSSGREADFSAPDNPRRLRLALEKILTVRAAQPKPPPAGSEH